MPFPLLSGARISVYQPPPGHTSTTVSPGLTPKKASVWAGWRYRSRATFAGVRVLAATAAAIAASGRAAGAAAIQAMAIVTAAVAAAVAAAIERGVCMGNLLGGGFSQGGTLIGDTQARLWIAAAACLALALFAAWRERRRKRRDDPDAIGPIDWVSVQVFALIALAILAALAFHA